MVPPQFFGAPVCNTQSHIWQQPATRLILTLWLRPGTRLTRRKLFSSSAVCALNCIYIVAATKLRVRTASTHHSSKRLCFLWDRKLFLPTHTLRDHWLVSGALVHCPLFQGCSRFLECAAASQSPSERVHHSLPAEHHAWTPFLRRSQWIWSGAL